LLLAGCGSNPDGQELAIDYAADFAGVWYGTGTYTYRQNGQTSTTNQALRPLVVVTGKNALQLPAYCSDSDPGVSAKVTSPTHFELKPYSCPVSQPGNCPFSVTVDHGGGSLFGSGLQIDFHGTIEQPASSGCQALTVDYDLVFSGTHTSPGSPLEKPSPPENVTVTKDQFYGRFDLSWTTSGAVGQIDVQARQGNGDWQDMGQLYGSPSFVELANPPERTPVAFRLRNTNLGVHSDWSAEVTENTGLYVPQVTLATGGGGQIQLGWFLRQDVTGLIIERSTGTTGWTPVTTVPPGVARYTDTQVDELQLYSYRLRWVDGAIEGYNATLYPMNPGVRAPTALVAVPGVERVDLSWKNQSSAASEIVIVRTASLAPGGFSGSELAHLPPTATSFSDVGVATGLYRYEVHTRDTGVAESVASVPVATLPPSGSWDVSVLQFPAGDLVGAYGTGIDDTGQVLAWSYSRGLMGSDSPAWLPHQLAHADGLPLVVPIFELDASFHPHIVWMRSTVQNTLEAAAMQEWYDGSAWRTEELVRLQLDPWWVHALDPSGRPVVLTGKASGFRVVRWNGSAYVVEDTGASLASNTSVSALRIAVSPEGVIHALVQGTDGHVVHTWRDTSWKQEQVSLPSINETLQEIAASTGDRLTVTFFGLAGPQVDLVEKSGGVWGAPVTIPAATFFVDGQSLRLETSGTGAHPTLAMPTPSGLQIARSGDGWAPHTLTGTTAAMGIGYDASDKLWVLISGGSDFNGTTYLALFREK
jgi:hypothetical protein